MFVNLIVSFVYLYYFVLGSLVALAQHCWVVGGHSVGVLGIIIFFEIDFDCVELLIVFLEWYFFLVCYETCPFEMEIFYFSFFGFFLVGLIKKIFSVFLKIKCSISSLVISYIDIIFIYSFFNKRCVLYVVWTSSLDFWQLFQILLSEFELYTSFLIGLVSSLLKYFIRPSRFHVYYSTVPSWSLCSLASVSVRFQIDCVIFSILWKADLVVILDIAKSLFNQEIAFWTSSLLGVNLGSSIIFRGVNSIFFENIFEIIWWGNGSLIEFWQFDIFNKVIFDFVIGREFLLFLIIELAFWDMFLLQYLIHVPDLLLLVNVCLD